MAKLTRTYTLKVEFDRAERCIYCGSRGGADGLRVEHIIPDSIGGRLIYPGASCHGCEQETHAFEGRVVSAAYGDTRAIFGMRRGNKRKWPSHFSVSVKRGDDTHIVPVTEEDLPTANWLVILNHRPPLLDNKPALNGLKVDLALWSPSGDYLQRLQKVGPGIVDAAKTFNFDDFFRFLNKIAYSFAHATLRGQLNPLTNTFVYRDQGKRVRRYVGGDIVGRRDGRASDIHELDLVQIQSGSILYIAVRVHLFAFADFPAYVVIVGTANDLTMAPEGATYPVGLPERWIDRHLDQTSAISPNTGVRFHLGQVRQR
ncbi:HNH endonuclease [Mesorhizobium sp. Cs1299R1N3]|uniref:HNH endonuclease n=1 Tax=Mesorhizobium sp. Cs1299R1N3 TaxID=3015173 RepID=UPI00301D127D